VSLGSSDKHTNHYTTETTSLNLNAGITYREIKFVVPKFRSHLHETRGNGI
jgi:hypothetical protein